MVELRTYAFLDSLQPQFASFIATVAKGFLPVAGEAALYLEVAPGMEINALTDVAIKATGVMPGMMIVERAFGLLEIHGKSQGDVRHAGRAILDSLDITADQRYSPRTVTQQVIRHVDDYHTQLINRTRHGQMILGGQTLYILETEPAGWAALAANEAEKAAEINIVEVRTFGAYGRVYLAGEEADVVEGAAAASRALENIPGRTDWRE
ncbi:MAG: hypothetical protein J7M19_07745 [Planctomycetes bacterium]|nr:hypothetical protein [Planctomycetota bacterium]